MSPTAAKENSSDFLSDYYFHTKIPVAFTSPLALYRQASVNLLDVGQVKRKLYGQNLEESRCTFKKFYLTPWNQDIFPVTKIIPRVLPVYWLQDYAEDEIEGVFYAKELQKVH